MANEEAKTETDLMLNLATELDMESDRAMAILAGSYLDHLLRRLITLALNLQEIPEAATKFLFEGPNAGLATFSSRIEMARRLGLFDKGEIRDLTLIRKVRNEFAHEFIGISFETGSVANRCWELEAAKVDEVPPTARECFKKAAVRLMVNVLLQIQSFNKHSPNTSANP